MIHTHRYSLGIYVNRNGVSNEESGNPHTFLGLKIEKTQCNPLQIDIQKNLLENFLKVNMLEKAKECEAKIKDMQCFIDEETLEDLRMNLSQKKYQYYFTSHKNFKSHHIPIILESDLLNSKIINCPYTLAGIPMLCTKVVSVKGSLSQKRVNNECVILQELIANSKTDKGVPLKVSFVPTKFKYDYSLGEIYSSGF